MKAVACQDAKLELVDRPTPGPGPGQVVLDVLACGSCGSELHARQHADAQAEVLVEAGYDGFMRSGQQVVLGHEFCGEVAGYGARGPGRRPGSAHPW
jgi:threonine dehydrogenase-like Zn-dependent dehydrogenase